MNWRRAYAAFQIWFMVCLTSAIGASSWSFLVAGLCRLMFKLDENIALLAIGLPMFLILLVVLIRFLPKPLRKAGILSDEPERFGPWFKP
ncbi:hypothetical protein A8H39_18230 [Paraburkholderia fungorum]|jgi:hypothetical protein|nr:hypothetical protein [Paraburkholderia fungorum]PNE57574.1 hypothetical protein A8H39_18230 [Paraburkholderia fungorum]PRZ54513.1 hypothetical protein BX589_10646 [Paraburkholderia fungorum]